MDSPRTGLAILAVAAPLPFVASLPTLQVLAIALVGIGTASAVLVRRWPVLMLLVLALLAWSSRPTVEIGALNLRVEQPAILALGVVILWCYRPTAAKLLASHRSVALGVAVWMGAGIVSALLVSPDASASLRILVWWGMSLAAAGIAAVLAAHASPEAVSKAFVVTGVAHALVAVYAWASGWVPAMEWGGYVHQSGLLQFRAFGLAWEPNILASGLAMLLPFAIERYVRRAVLPALTAVAVIAIGVGLALTRASWVALAVGALVFGAILLLTRREHLPRFAFAALVVALGVALGSAVTLAVLAPPPSTGPDGSPPPSVAPSSPSAGSSPSRIPASPVPTTSRIPASPLPTTSRIPASPLPTTSPSRSPASPSPTLPSQTAEEVLLDDGTLTYRLDRVFRALNDLRSSPLIGMGPGSYGLRHVGLSPDSRADHLAVFPVTILYDAGLLGILGFLIFVFSLVRRLVRRDAIGVAAPYLVSLVIMAICYVSTDALRFSHNWLIVGAAIGVSATVARTASRP